MSTTRPIAGRDAVKDVSAKRVQAAKAGETAQAAKVNAGAVSESKPAQVAESVQATAQLMEVADTEFKRADEEKLEELKNAIKEGRFKVNPDKLAARLIADAFEDFR